MEARQADAPRHSLNRIGRSPPFVRVSQEALPDILARGGMMWKAALRRFRIVATSETLRASRRFGTGMPRRLASNTS